MGSARTELSAGLDSSVAAAVLLAVRARPERLALADAAEQFTYAELDALSAAVAVRLREAGAGRGDCVGLLTRRSARAIAAMLGITRAGAAYVHLDPQLPPDRLRFIARQARMRAVVSDASSSVVLVDDVIDLGAAGDAIDAPELLDLAFDAPGPDDPMYVMYTSGSTGEPKGILVPHRAVTNLLRWQIPAFEISERDRSSEVSSFTFDASILEIWPYLCVGASVHVVPDSVRPFPHALRRWFEQQQITTAWLTSPLAEELMAAGSPDSSPLRLLVTGGDRLHTRPTSSFPVRVINVYGPTETTVITTAGDVHPDEEATGLPSIGMPIPGARLHVLDASLRSVPDGTEGELWIAGSGVSDGYLHRPDLAAERFVSERALLERGELVQAPTGPGAALEDRAYRSGDIVRRLADGRFEFVGRADTQIKLRGLRIEIGEIEARLVEHPDVIRAVVRVEGDDEADRHLVAYVQSPPGGLDVAAVRTQLGSWLPHYMVPTRFESVDEFDLTANGKIDRSRAPAAPHVPLSAAKASQ